MIELQLEWMMIAIINQDRSVTKDMHIYEQKKFVYAKIDDEIYNCITIQKTLA